jgi:ribonucleotide monophosphatase NagD (HAD superfamily)
MAALLHELVGTVDGDAANTRHIVVGDLPATDGLLARLLGYRFGLVLSGVTTSAAAAEPVPDLVAADLAGMVDLLLG